MIAFDGTFEGFRDAARAALHANVAPSDVAFDDGGGQASLFAAKLDVPAGALRVSRRYVELGQTVAMHRDAKRWPILYRVLWRLVHGEHDLMARASDPDIRVLERMASNVRRDIHKVHAFVRFRKLELDDGPLWVSSYKPDHHVLRAAVPHFVDRMGRDPFVIATPDGTARWDGKKLSFTPPDPALAHVDFGADEEEIESLFRSYYSSVFNPARLNLRATTAEMPKHFWSQIPEAKEIARLVQDAPRRTGGMIDRGLVAQPPTGASLPVLRDAAATCTSCDIACNATQTVFGEGPEDAQIVLIGEQPGDEEDRHGHPFVGPAGRVLRALVDEAGLRMEDLYVTNAVKHFKWEARGKHRLHQKPAYREVKACHPWLDAELRILRPSVIVCLGVTAAQSLLGPGFRLNQHKGKLVPQPWARTMLTTFHPSAILRMEGDAAIEARAQLLDDLRRAKQLAAEESAAEHPEREDDKGRPRHHE